MKVSNFWKPIIASLIATPFCLLISFVFAGYGHGTYLPAKVLFPYAMISATLMGKIILPFIFLSIIQLPIYGFVLGVANKKGRFIPVAGFILFLHLAVLILCLVIPNGNY